MFRRLVFVCVCLSSIVPVRAAADRIVINRARHTLTVPSPAGGPETTISIGIGRGGLKRKTDMRDYVTPTGHFTVDLVLSRETEFNDIAPNLRAKYIGDPRFGPLVRDRTGLAQLFENMLSIDFDRDGAPDAAYGAAYVGLDSNEAVTGPKMSLFGSTPYWFSIALHGTPNPARDIGASNSGGCIHLPEPALLELVRSRRLAVGTAIDITDKN